MFNFKKTAAAFILFAASAASQATVMSGNLNDSGYALYGLNLTSASQVDFTYLNGDIPDPIISLFDHTGAHLISADDSGISFYPHLTQVLAAGDYTLAINASGNGAGVLENVSVAFDDGYNNNGLYFVGGTGSLDAYIAGRGNNSDLAVAGAAYGFDFESVSLDNQGGNQGNNVPEPASLALFGASAAALAFARRRQRRG